MCPHVCVFPGSFYLVMLRDNTLAASCVYNGRHYFPIQNKKCVLISVYIFYMCVYNYDDLQ